MPTKLFSSAVTLFLLLASIAPAYAQHDEQNKGQGKPQQGEQHQQEKAAPLQREQERPAQQQSQQRAPQQTPQRQQTPAPPQSHAQSANKTTQQQRTQQAYGGVYHAGVKSTEPTYGGVHPSGVPQQQGQVRAGFTQSRAKSWSSDHRTWQDRGGYTGYRVPDDRFNLYFGGNHFFRIGRLPLLFVGGYPRFQYDGYWVTFVDPWPEMWAPTWYETDDVYLDYNGDGY